jgi:uncharacterized protein YtpQ (UPF0354 family)
MLSSELKTFVHPQQAYRLEFPAHWEHQVKDDGRSCGFGPFERDDVGLWISILPISVDTDRIVDDLPAMFAQALEQASVTNIRRDPSLRHHALKADVLRDGEGGHHWLLAGGDLVLLATSQVPVAERETWSAPFERLMASLRITRENEHLRQKVGDEVLQRLKAARPDQEYQFDEKGIRGRDHVVYLDNVFREVRADPERRETIIHRFVEGVTASAHAMLGHEAWDDVCQRILPVLKPIAYIKEDGPTKHVFATDWLPETVICYVINGDKSFRFITGWDLNRWGVDEDRLRATATENLSRLPWPKKMEGSRLPDGSRIILVCTDDSFSASRLLHPDFHHYFSQALGSPFLAGVPDRDTLVTFSNRRELRKRIGQQVRKDHDRAAYPITRRLFLVTRDGVAPAEEG